MDRVATAFFDGQHEGVWIVLEALYESENNEDREINREWVSSTNP